MTERIDEDDEMLAGLIETVARQYRKQINENTLEKNEVRLEIVRKLGLIADAIKGRMRASQMSII